MTEARAITTVAVLRPRNAPRLSVEAAKAGLRLEVDATCERHRNDAGGNNGATCPLLEPQKGDPEGFAAVMGDGFSVDIIVQESKSGTVEERAHRAAAELCELVPPDPPVVVTFADRRFLRVEDKARICFVTADDRPEVAAILFRDLDRDSSMLPVFRPELVRDLAHEADIVMGTLRTSSVLTTEPATPAPARVATSPGVSVLFYLVIVVVVGAFALFVFVKLAVLARLLGLKWSSGPKRIEEPGASRPRAPGGPQLAGLKCATCKRNILAERDAVHCTECDLPVHKGCLSRHTSVAHGPPPGAYR